VKRSKMTAALGRGATKTKRSIRARAASVKPRTKLRPLVHTAAGMAEALSDAAVISANNAAIASAVVVDADLENPASAPAVATITTTTAVETSCAPPATSAFQTSSATFVTTTSGPATASTCVPSVSTFVPTPADVLLAEVHGSMFVKRTASNSPPKFVDAL